MIISDRHNFTFIHIPKCAGTSVRSQLEKYDDTGGKYSRKVTCDPILGKLDYTHLTLDLLAKISPDHLVKVKHYESFAIVRDPHARFRSAVAQRLKMYKGVELAQSSERRITREVEDIVNHLAMTEKSTDPEFIHFSKQSDYLYFEGEQVVKNIFPISNVDLLVERIGKIVGEKIPFEAVKNQTLAFRSQKLRNISIIGRNIAEKCLPMPISRAVRNSARKILMKKFVPDNKSIFESNLLRRFLQNYYTEDFSLWMRVANDSKGIISPPREL